MKYYFWSALIKSRFARRAKVLVALSLNVAIVLNILIAGPAQSSGGSSSSSSTNLPLGSIAATTPGTRYGMNVNPPIYSGAYTDILMCAQVGPLDSTQYGVTVTPQGYPTSCTNLPSQQWGFQFYTYGYPNGVYNFYGEGIFDLNKNKGRTSVVPGSVQTHTNSNGVPVITAQIVLQTPGPMPADFTGVTMGASDYLIIENINPQSLPNGTPNNFHLTMPGYPAWQDGDSFKPTGNYPLFTDAYLQSFAPFCCLRFMNWMDTNGNITPYSWANRAQPNVVGGWGWGNAPFPQNINQGGRGTAYEYMIELCNETGCDMWINVPLQATDDWKTNMALLIKNNLNPYLHVYIEHGNELWNWSFGQSTGWVYNQAQINFASTSQFPAYYWQGEEMALLLMSDINIMEPLLGQQMCRAILAGQFSYNIYYLDGLAYINQAYGPPGNFIYGIAGAPYVGALNADADTTLPAVFTDMQNCINTDTLPILQANMKIAQQYGVNFCGYESGQSLPANNQTQFNLMLSAPQDPGMATIYQNFANVWQSNGGDLCEFFANDGAWVSGPGAFWSVTPQEYCDMSPGSQTTKFIICSQIASVCNCGNMPPPPPPPPAPSSLASPPPPPAPAPSPAPAPAPAPSSPSPTSSNLGGRYLGGGRWWSPRYGNYSDKPSFDTPTH